MITQDRLKHVVSYDLDTGIFVRHYPLSRKQKFKRVGNVDARGYIHICIDRKQYYAHRLAWLYVYGEFPKEIDHINGDPSDNSIINLRLASSSQNKCNRVRLESARTPYRGVYWADHAKAWCARIKFDRNKTHIGYFKSAEAAALAYDRAAVILHGEFARLNFPNEAMS